MLIKLYTMDDCIYCTMLKARLNHEKVQYEEIKDAAVIAEKGFATLPQLEIYGDVFDFNQAISFLNRGLA